MDEDGFLLNMDDWLPEAACGMAAADGVELGDDHWMVINFLREYYQKYQIAPPVRVLTKTMARRLGADKGNSRHLYALFCAGPAQQACRYAGLPKPTGCI